MSKLQIDTSKAICQCMELRVTTECLHIDGVFQPTLDRMFVLHFHFEQTLHNFVQPICILTCTFFACSPMLTLWVVDGSRIWILSDKISSQLILVVAQSVTPNYSGYFVSHQCEQLAIYSRTKYLMLLPSAYACTKDFHTTRPVGTSSSTINRIILVCMKFTTKYSRERYCV